MNKSRPVGVVVSSMWFLVAGFANGIAGIAFLLSLSLLSKFSRIAAGLMETSPLALVFELLGAVFLVLCIARLATSWGVMDGSGWARTWGIALSIISLIGEAFVYFAFVAIEPKLLTSPLALLLLMAFIDGAVAGYLLSDEARNFFVGASQGFQMSQMSWPEQPTQADAFQPFLGEEPTLSASPVKTQLLNSPVESRGWLVVSSGPDKGKRFTLESEHVIGRDPSTCDIVLSDSTVSRQHARVRLEGRIFYIYDLGSTAGTKVNGFRVQRSRLMDDDKITLGNTEMIAKLVNKV